MLEKLIHEIQAGGTLEPILLANRLDTSPKMVMAMLDHLARLGVLQKLSKCTDSDCANCSLSRPCRTQRKGSSNLWKLSSS